jgi:hypothetical protein
MQGIGATMSYNAYFRAVGKTRLCLPQVATSEGAGIWSLAEACIEPGVLYQWELEPAEDNHSVQPDQPAGPQGWFWILPPDLREQLERGKQVVAKGSDPDFIAIGLALFMCEMQLYQEALEEIKRGPDRSDCPARKLMAHSVQALIYQQMSKHLAQKDAEQPSPPIWFRTWAAGRERYHRERAEALRDMDAIALYA